MSVNALTIDIEDWYHGLLDQSSGWDRFPARLPEMVAYILNKLELYNIKATFFILGHAAKRHPEVVKEIFKAGHEIASHGYSHQFIYTQSLEVFREETQKSIDILSDITSEPILGYRASTFTITNKTIWALDVLEEIGFKYDSSIFPVKNPYYGIPNFQRYPHKLKGRNLWEFPPTTVRCMGFNFPLAGGFYLRLLPVSVFRYFYHRMNRARKPVVFYIHPWELDHDQPRDHYNLSWRMVRFYGIKSMPRRLDCLLKAFKWCPIRELLEQM